MNLISNTIRIPDKDTAYYKTMSLDEQDLEWDEDVAEDIMDRVKHIGRHYKNHFNRPSHQIV